MAMIKWVIDNQLARGQRPGYSGWRGRQVPKVDVDRWIEDVKTFSVKSIICLLAEDQLQLYSGLPLDLISYYRQAGLNVEHVPVKDLQHPPLTAEHLKKIWMAYQVLPKPVLVHCSAGVDRTGQALRYIQQQLEAASKPLQGASDSRALLG
jgi:protein tyrosine phosphatase